MMRSATGASRSSEMSSMCERPCRSAAILPGSTSSPITSHPASAKATESGRPTYPSPTMPIFIDIRLLRQEVEVGADHQADQLLEVRLRLPAELALGLGRVADEQVDLGRALERVVDPHARLPLEPDLVERDLDTAPHGVRLAGCDHEVA